MSLDPAHEALRKQPPLDVLSALLCAVIDNQHGDPVRSVYCLIACASAMAKQLQPVDQVLAALEMHRAAIDILPPQPGGKPIMRQNGQWVETK